MMLNFEWKAYIRPFRQAIETAHGTMQEHKGIVLRVWKPSSDPVFVEVSPLETFGTESYRDALNWIGGIDGQLSSIKDIPQTHIASRTAFSMAYALLGGSINYQSRSLRSSALLTGGPRCLQELAKLTQSGFKVFKYKLTRKPADDLTLVNQIFSQLPEGAKLRVDANGSLDAERTEYWLKQFEGAPIEYFEQPMPKGEEPIMRLFTKQYQTPIALDESVSTFSNLAKIYDDGWRGPMIIKPSILDSIPDFIEWRKLHQAPLIYSSTFESGIGFHNTLLIASSDPSDDLAEMGFGTLDYFNQDKFQLYRTSSQLNAWKYGPEDLQSLWDQI